MRRQKDNAFKVEQIMTKRFQTLTVANQTPTLHILKCKKGTQKDGQDPICQDLALKP